MAKKIKLEKETRKLMESIADLVKVKKGKFKFKSKGKKTIKKIKKSCIHWLLNKKVSPAVDKDPNNPMNWKCKICGASFPIRPATTKENKEIIDNVIELVNQLQFFSVKMGGDADDTKLFIRLKMDLAKLKKAQKNIINQANKRQQWETKKSDTENTVGQFDGFSGYSYRN